ncbi:MAG: heparan-alpha-glucosaminide N-acetyltransferase [Candidatus Diapherotrites archaeon]|nr:heparan-alpha-glucosaminide N-acetyltransferase [Candidatus Diapherotrites archaeon]
MAEKERFWEIDSVRGIALVLMAIFHLFFDLNYFRFFQSNNPAWQWQLSAAFIAFLFLSVAGISLSISHAKNPSPKKFLLRGAKIFSFGLLITAATWIYPHEGFIQFGILHLIGLSIILSIPFLRFKKLNLALGIAFLAAGFFLQTQYFDFPWLLWLGFMPHGFYTLDYYPLLPWFGLILFGIFLGKEIYPNGKRFFKEKTEPKPLRFLSFLGRHSLAFYLLHQPAIIAALFLAFGFPG